MQELTLQADQRRAWAVGRVASHRVADGREVDSQLMGATGEQERLHEGPTAKAFAHPEMRLRGAALASDCHALPVARVTPDRAVDQAFLFFDRAAQQDQVALFDAAALHL